MLDVSDHVERIEAAVSSSSAAARCRVAASWRRSKTLHHLDPADAGPIRRITSQQLQSRLKAESVVIHLAANELDRLQRLVGVPGSGLFLCDRDGIVLERRTSQHDAPLHDDIGLVVGADCSETYEGTNGIGTSIAEQTPVRIDQDQHYFARNRTFTSIGAPIFGTQGELIGVLALVAVAEGARITSQAMVASTLVQAAKRIESHLFRQCFQHHRIVLAQTREVDDLALLAVDQDDFVVGATRAARQNLGVSIGTSFSPCPAADILEQATPARDMHDIRRIAILQALHRASGNVSAAARQLGMGRATLYNQMKRLDIRPS
ncbi:MAG: helix-turn-helix domain-containing protein [Pseudomonadota bacterium]